MKKAKLGGDHGRPTRRYPQNRCITVTVSGRRHQLRRALVPPLSIELARHRRTTEPKTATSRHANASIACAAFVKRTQAFLPSFGLVGTFRAQAASAERLNLSQLAAKFIAWREFTKLTRKSVDRLLNECLTCGGSVSISTS
jgi:hypothetical protein